MYITHFLSRNHIFQWWLTNIHISVKYGKLNQLNALNKFFCHHSAQNYCQAISPNFESGLTLFLFQKITLKSAQMNDNFLHIVNVDIFTLYIGIIFKIKKIILFSWLPWSFGLPLMYKNTNRSK